MNKVELVEAVATAAGLTKADATRAIDATFNAIQEALDGDFSLKSIRKKFKKLKKEKKKNKVA